jgi:hypothetical protein
LTVSRNSRARLTGKLTTGAAAASSQRSPLTMNAPVAAAREDVAVASSNAALDRPPRNQR